MRFRCSLWRLERAVFFTPRSMHAAVWPSCRAWHEQGLASISAWTRTPYTVPRQYWTVWVPYTKQGTGTGTGTVASQKVAGGAGLAHLPACFKCSFKHKASTGHRQLDTLLDCKQHSKHEDKRAATVLHPPNSLNPRILGLMGGQAPASNPCLAGSRTIGLAAPGPRPRTDIWLGHSDSLINSTHYSRYLTHQTRPDLAHLLLFPPRHGLMPG